MIRRFIIAGLVACAAGFAAPAIASADYAANKSVAYAKVTNDCLRYQGCSQITLLGNSNGGGECSTWAFKFHTIYSGWVSKTVYVDAPGGAFCIPGYLYANKSADKAHGFPYNRR